MLGTYSSIYLFLVLVGLLCYFLYTIKNKFDYWKERGVPSIHGTHIIYGNTKKISSLQNNSAEVYGEFYHEFKRKGLKHGGIYNYNRPIWILVDPNLIKNIVMSDFQYFAAHNPVYFKSLFFNNLFHMSGESWKDMRKKLTPTFTSGKMKMMFNILLEKTNGLADLVGDMVMTRKPAEMRQLVARFTTDVIGSCGFGIECDSLNDINSEFFQNGQEIFRKLSPTTAPKLYKILLISVGLIRRFNLELDAVENFFRKLVKDTVQYREENKVVRKDFLHLMIQLKNRGGITDEINENDIFKKSGNKDGFSMEDLAGECMLFFMAGFETSSATVSFAFLELSEHQDVQDKLRKEIHEVLKKYNGVLTYDALQEMTYCENVINETLRKYPPIPTLPRMCTKDYRVPDTDVVIAKNTLVQIPLLAIHNDPDYFPEPEKFIPERFDAKNRSQILPFTYMPFGEGPRQCLGLRFGLMQSKAAIATLINRYKFTLNKKTHYPPKFSPSPVLSIDGGIWVEATEAN